MGPTFAFFKNALDTTTTYVSLYLCDSQATVNERLKKPFELLRQ